jgi:hypothetical protein
MGEAKRRAKSPSNEEPYRYRINGESFKYINNIHVELISPNMAHYRILFDMIDDNALQKLDNEDLQHIKYFREKISSTGPEQQYGPKEALVFAQFITKRHKRNHTNSLLCINCDVGFQRQNPHINPSWILLFEADRNGAPYQSWHSCICQHCYDNCDMNEILDRKLEEITGGTIRQPGTFTVDPIN